MVTCFWTTDEEKMRLVDGLKGPGRDNPGKDHPQRNFNSDGRIVNY